MKILMGNKFHRLAGGVDKYFLDLCELMHAHGHEVVRFAMADEQNVPSEYSDYFAPPARYHGGSWRDRLGSAARFVYSKPAERQMSRLLRDTRPAIVHFQHVYHQLTTSVFRPVVDAGLPLVQSVHDYKLGCPRYTLFNTRTGELCDDCQGRHYVRAVVNRCYDGSLMRSLLLAVESYYNQLFETYQRSVDRFVVSNAHMRFMLERYGIAAERIVVIPNFVVSPDEEPAPDHDGYFLYFGRLSPEKGVEHLIRAMQLLPDERLKIVGIGPDENRLLQLAARLGVDNVDFLGPKWGHDLEPILERAMSVVVPSYWHENSPMVIYQSFAAGRPVIASRRGGIPDLIEHGVNGYLFEAGDVDELAGRMRELARDRERQVELGRRGWERARHEYSPRRHYEQLMNVYQELLSR